jgi:hypothetical protein
VLAAGYELRRQLLRAHGCNSQSNKQGTEQPTFQCWYVLPFAGRRRAISFAFHLNSLQVLVKE